MGLCFLFFCFCTGNHFPTNGDITEIAIWKVWLTQRQALHVQWTALAVIQAGGSGQGYEKPRERTNPGLDASYLTELSVFLFFFLLNPSFSQYLTMDFYHFFSFVFFYPSITPSLR